MMTVSKRTARLAGVLYLLVALLGLFAQMYVLDAIYAPGDAADTARNVMEHATLVRLGVVADLAMATSFIFLGMAFYRLFTRANKEVAAALVVVVAIGTALILGYALSQFAALLVASDSTYANALGIDGSNALTLLLMDIRNYGSAAAGIPFGRWMLPLGYLACTSGMFPRALGVVLMVASFGYLINTLIVFLLPDLGAIISDVVMLPAGLAEFWMVGYLLIFGLRTLDDPHTQPSAPELVPAW
jgi:hypothetical protein